jgi:hypothetical protein
MRHGGIQRQLLLNGRRVVLYDGRLEMGKEAGMPRTPRCGVVLAELVAVIFSDEWVRIHGVGGLRVWGRH